MKGAPLWRGLLIAVVIALVGVALWLGQGHELRVAATQPVAERKVGAASRNAANFIVQMSSGVSRVRLYDASVVEGPWEESRDTTAEWHGKWRVMPALLGVQVEAQPAAGEQRVFVKLIIEPDGGEALVRVFDGVGGFEEQWEIP